MERAQNSNWDVYHIRALLASNLLRVVAMSMLCPRTDDNAMDNM